MGRPLSGASAPKNRRPSLIERFAATHPQPAQITPPAESTVAPAKPVKKAAAKKAPVKKAAAKPAATAPAKKPRATKAKKAVAGGEKKFDGGKNREEFKADVATGKVTKMYPGGGWDTSK